MSDNPGTTTIINHLAASNFTTLASDVLCNIRSARDLNDLRSFLEAVTREFGCRYFALVHHRNIRNSEPGCVDLKAYPDAIVDRLFKYERYRRDPIIRAAFFSGGAFLWSDLSRYIQVERFDRLSLEAGAREGLNEGITVPYFRCGDCIGSCTFAGMRTVENADRILGPAQMIGIFAFQAALRLVNGDPVPAPPARLHPRPRDCVILAGRGLSNKEIARALSLAPRTVDGYLTEARRLFDAHDRTELAIAAIMAGEVGIEEIARRQPE